MQSAGANSRAPRILGVSTVAFTVCFAVWTIFAIIGIRIRQELGLSETQFGLMVGTPVLTGSLIRISSSGCSVSTMRRNPRRLW